MSLKLVAPLAFTCHCTVGAGVPVAAAVKVTVWPALSVWSAGLVVTLGGELTVSWAALLVRLTPQELVKMARYCLLLSVVVAVKLSVVEVAFEIFEKLLPPSVLTCHCTLGAGLLLAATVKVAVLLLHTVCETGWVLTTGAPGTVSMAAGVATPREG